MRRRNRAAIGQYEATLVLIVISLSLVSVVYSGLKRESRLSAQPVFVNRETKLAGSPDIFRLIANSSSQTTLTSFSIDSVSSSSGVLAFDGSSYSASASLCAAGVTTFFSVYVSQGGTLQASSNGQSWISGAWSTSATVVPGWREVMFQRATSCSVTLPGGQVVLGPWTPASTVLSALPIEGSPSGTSFTFHIPSAGPHRFLITSLGGFDAAPL